MGYCIMELLSLHFLPPLTGFLSQTLFLKFIERSFFFDVSTLDGYEF